MGEGRPRSFSGLAADATNREAGERRHTLPRES